MLLISSTISMCFVCLLYNCIKLNRYEDTVKQYQEKLSELENKVKELAEKIDALNESGAK